MADSFDWKAAFEGERALVNKLSSDYAASRVGIMAKYGELHEHLELMLGYFEEETSQGDGISERHWDGYVGSKGVLTRTAVDRPQWENAQIEIQELLSKASEVPGLSASLDEARYNLARAVSLLNMLDRSESRHPDVAEFLDSMNGGSDG